ncbi:MAG: hypothetical protein IPN15_22250 [Saprospiraceae bacterium]|nr:hypothetical protein [Candidatus Vicinibacter affinis]MBK8644838.1 hypothetical protein [Candidatus Vicinibacter affinis]
MVNIENLIDDDKLIKMSFGNQVRQIKIKKIILIYFIATLSSVFNTAISQDVIRDLMYKFVGMDTFNTLDKEKPIILDFWKSIKFLDKYERDQNKFKGEVSFGLNGDDGDVQDQLKINSGIKITRGIYPGELEFSSNLGVVINNNKFNEDVSNIYLAYDYHPKVWDSLALENFAFLSRFTDGFLGVQQRYEVGVGTIFAYWSKKLTKKGKEEESSLNIIDYDKSKFNAKSGIWGICDASNSQCLIYLNKELKSGDIENLEKAKKETKLSIRKLFSKFRGGVLVGVLFETEKIRFTDSITVLDPSTTLVSRKSKEVDFDVTQKLRWEIRPTLDFKPSDSWSLKFRPYFKLPMPWRWYEYEVNGNSNKRFDYRIDFSTILSITLAEPAPNKTVGLDFSYNLFYDNAPQRRVLSELDPLGNGILFRAGRLHQVYRLGLKIGF